MQVFLQYFVMTVCAFGFGYLVLLNNAKLALFKRVTLGVIFTVVAFFAAWTMQRIPAPTTEVSSRAASPLPSAPEPSRTAVTNPANAEPQGLPHPQGQLGTEPPAPSKSKAPSSPSVQEVSAVAEPFLPSPQEVSAAADSPGFLRVEVLYDGPTAAGGVVNPKGIMAKELIDAGFQVLMPGGPASLATRPEPAPSAPAARPLAPAPLVTSEPAPSQPAVPRPPAGLTVKQIFDFVRKAQQGKLGEEPPGSFLSFSTPLFAATAPAAAQVVVALRASLRRLREYQGIFSTEAQMEIVAVTAGGKRIQSVVSMAGPESARGFGLDWEQAEEKALREISAQMCPAFARKLRQKLAQEQ